LVLLSHLLLQTSNRLHEPLLRGCSPACTFCLDGFNARSHRHVYVGVEPMPLRLLLEGRSHLMKIPLESHDILFVLVELLQQLMVLLLLLLLY
jgi:hypothetical protein